MEKDLMNLNEEAQKIREALEKENDSKIISEMEQDLEKIQAKINFIENIENIENLKKRKEEIEEQLKNEKDPGIIKEMKSDLSKIDTYIENREEQQKEMIEKYDFLTLKEQDKKDDLEKAQAEINFIENIQNIKNMKKRKEEIEEQLKNEKDPSIIKEMKSDLSKIDTYIKNIEEQQKELLEKYDFLSHIKDGQDVDIDKSNMDEQENDDSNKNNKDPKKYPGTDPLDVEDGSKLPDKKKEGRLKKMLKGFVTIGSLFAKLGRALKKGAKFIVSKIKAVNEKFDNYFIGEDDEKTENTADLKDNNKNSKDSKDNKGMSDFKDFFDDFRDEQKYQEYLEGKLENPVKVFFKNGEAAWLIPGVAEPQKVSDNNKDKPDLSELEENLANNVKDMMDEENESKTDGYAELTEEEIEALSGIFNKKDDEENKEDNNPWKADKTTQQKIEEIHKKIINIGKEENNYTESKTDEKAQDEGEGPDFDE